MLNILFSKISPQTLIVFHWQYKLKTLLLQFLAIEVIVISALKHKSQ